MSTISNTLALNDAMSPTLRSIASALSSLTASFEELSRLSGRAINPSNIEAASRATRNAENAQDNYNQSLREGESAADGLWQKIKGLVAAYAGWSLVKHTVEWSDEMTMLQARLDLINDGTRTTAELMQQVYGAAQRSHASLQGTAAIVARIGNNAREAFSSNDELLVFAEQLQKQFTISGAGAQEAQYALIQLSQGLAAGALRGEELNSVFEQAPTVIRTIADYMKVPVGQIRQLASEGKITADIVKNAMFAAAEDTDKKFAAMPLTFEAAWGMAKNTFQMNMLGLQKILSDTFNTAQFQNLMNSLTSAVSTFAAVSIPIIKSVVAVVGFLYDNWDLIAPVVYSVVGAMLAYSAAMKIATLWAMRHIIVEKLGNALKAVGVIAQYAWAAAMGVSASATAAATAAQLGLNTAMLASPVTWIIAAIAAIIGLLYLTVAIINRVTGENISATGIITGTIYGLWAYIKNVLAYIWNSLVAVAEFLYNVWTNPVYSLKKLLHSLLEAFSGLFLGVMRGLDVVVTGIVKGFAWAINSIIRGINVAIDAANALGAGVNRIQEIRVTSSVANSAERLVNKMLAGVDPGKAPSGYKSFGGAKMNFADPVKYAEKGYEAGAKFADDPMGAIKKAMGLGQDPAIQQMAQNMAQTAKNTAQTAKNTTPKAEEDYKYLRDIMAGRAVDRLSGTDIRIQMNNNNNVNSALDLDSIVNALTQKLNSAMDSAAEGVHP